MPEIEEIRESLTIATASAVRKAVREGAWTSPTRGLARGYMQAGLVGLPSAQADDFLLFCQRNPIPCPLIEVSETGLTRYAASGADLRTDLPAYNAYRDGELFDQGHEVGRQYGEGLVWFLIGCSYSFEYLLEESGINLRGMQQGRGNPLFITDRQCNMAGSLHGLLVVSMRPIPVDKIGVTSHLSGKLPLAHGVPVHVGDPLLLGIKDISKPDFGTPAEVLPGELPVFWACSVTPQVVARECKLPLMITQKPGHMFLTDLKVLSLLS